tara:strand:+ start:72 stop:779 length:708 start_codon:yes stop_codon:yes gene_type:complete
MLMASPHPSQTSAAAQPRLRSGGRFLDMLEVVRVVRSNGPGYVHAIDPQAKYMPPIRGTRVPRAQAGGGSDARAETVSIEPTRSTQLEHGTMLLAMLWGTHCHKASSPRHCWLPRPPGRGTASGLGRFMRSASAAPVLPSSANARTAAHRSTFSQHRSMGAGKTTAKHIIDLITETPYLRTLCVDCNKLYSLSNAASLETVAAQLRAAGLSHVKAVCDSTSKRVLLWFEGPRQGC